MLWTEDGEEKMKILLQDNSWIFVGESEEGKRSVLFGTGGFFVL